MKKIIDQAPPSLDTVAHQTMQTYSGYKALAKVRQQAMTNSSSCVLLSEWTCTAP